MALHTGSAQVRDDDYFGQPLDTRRAAALVGARWPGPAFARDAGAGARRLPAALPCATWVTDACKDLIRPERVFQLLARGLPADFPPLRSLDALANNLPIQATSFVGREREIVDVKALLQRARLLTLTGAGGAGKTRLSLQVAADCSTITRTAYGSSSWRRCATRRSCRGAVAAALGVAEEPGDPLLDTLVDACREKDLLLVLDNCEHLIVAAAALCQALLSGCRGVAILATSREALAFPGKRLSRALAAGAGAGARRGAPDLGADPVCGGTAVRRSRAGGESGLPGDDRECRRRWRASATGWTASRWRSSSRRHG